MVLKDYTDEEIRRIAYDIRIKSVQMVYSANSGHPGGSLSVADILAVLYFREMNVDPEVIDQKYRDRFVMSKGHASPALYATLSMRGFFPTDLLTGFRKISSKLEGHVHYGVPGVEASTGSLGQGLGIGVGMAIASKLDSGSNRVYVIIGDGEIEEGSIWESFMAGSKYKLDNLIVILDRNGVQLDGFTNQIMPMPNLQDRIRSFGWNVIDIDGHDVSQITSAIEQAKKNTGKPTLIYARTIKGKGVSYMENNPKYHGSAPESEELFHKAISELEAAA